MTTTDNFFQGDSVEITIEAFCVDAIDQATLVLPGGSSNVLVQDNDSPTLTVTLDRGLISENAASPAAVGTVRRNTLDNSQSLVVSLFSSDTTEAEVATPTVEIPAGSDSTTFGINAKDDFTPDGNQIVTITVQADGFNSGSSRLVVSDVDKPDLRVVQVIAPASGYTGRVVDLQYQVSNEGRQPATGPWMDRVYVSRDPWLDSGDQVLGNFPFAETIAAGQSQLRTAPITLPSTVDTYYVIVAADVGFDVDEILENNNQGISDPVRIEAAYSVTVSTDIEQAVMGTPIPLAGAATLAESGFPAANVPVAVHVVHEGGFVRTLQAVTNASGQYTAVFTPLPNEAGDYQVSAAHPGVSEPPAQDSFTMIGMRVLPASTSHEVIVGQSVTQTMELKNLSGVDLSDVQFAVLDAPPNLTVTVTPPAFDLVPGRDVRAFVYEIAASDLSTTEADLTLRVTTAEGPTLDVPISVRVKIAAGLLVGPASLQAGMLRGRLTPVEFEIRNDGGGETGPIEILLPQAPWLRSASGNVLPSLPPGATTKVSLVLNPAADQPLGPYPGNLVLRSSNADPVSIPFTFTAVSDATGDLRVTVVDESTYYGEGAPKVADA
ncbi:MAG: hypothetical protein JJ992_00310, partial [Planctomycetes bacterium]|nr:hypothetical protein [Planctomycetota bacterium]